MPEPGLTKAGLLEAKAILETVSTTVASHLPEYNYWGFSAYTLVLPYIFKEVGNIVIPQAAATGPVWSYLDSVCAVVVGLNQLRDKNAHRQVVTKLKGTLNVLSGIQLGVLSGVSFAAFGPAAFAAAFGLGFAMSLDETTRAIRRVSNPNYWLTDSLALLEKQSIMIDHLQDETTELQRMLETEYHKMADWALKRKKARLDALETEHRALKEDVMTRVKTMRVTDTDGTVNTLISNEINKYTKNKHASFYVSWLSHTLSPELTTPLSQLREECASEQHKAKETAIQIKEMDHLQNAAKENFIWGIAFVGTVLCCIPGLQTAGMAVVACASLLYLSKHLMKTYRTYQDNKINKVNDQMHLPDETSSLSPAVDIDSHSPEISDEHDDEGEGGEADDTPIPHPR